MRAIVCAAALLALVVTADAAARTPAVVTVTAGKPTEAGFALSPTTVKHGAVLFKVVNSGKLAHGFSIDGHSTKVIKPHAATTLSVVFTHPGKYIYQCVSTAPPPDFGPGYNDVPSDCGGGVLVVR